MRVRESESESESESDRESLIKALLNRAISPY